MIRYIKNNLLVDLILMSYVASIILFSYAEGKTYITKIVAVVLAIYFVFQGFVGRRKLPFTREWFFVLLWIFIATVSMFFAIEPELSISRIYTMMLIIPTSFMLFSIIVWRDSTKPIWLATILTTILVSILGLDNPLSYSDYGRLRGTLNNANLFGLVLLVSVGGLLYFFSIYKSKFVKLLIIPVMIFMFYMIAETGSRKALIMVIMVLGVYFYFIFRETVKKSIVGAMAIGVLGVSGLIGGAIYVQNSPHYDRIQRIITAIEKDDMSRAGGSERGRLQLYAKGFEVVQNNPGFGVGLDNFRVLSGGGFGVKVGTYSHSNIIELIAGTGIIGFLLYYAMYVMIAMRLFRLRKCKLTDNDRFHYLLIVTMFTVYVIYDFAMVSYYEKVSWLFLATYIAAVHMLENKERPRRAGPQIGDSKWPLAESTRFE